MPRNNRWLTAAAMALLLAAPAGLVACATGASDPAPQWRSSSVGQVLLVDPRAIQRDRRLPD